MDTTFDYSALNLRIEEQKTEIKFYRFAFQLLLEDYGLQDYLKERAAKEEALKNGTPFPGTEPAPKKTIRRSKVSKVDESTNF